MFPLVSSREKAMQEKDFEDITLINKVSKALLGVRESVLAAIADLRPHQ